MNFDKFYSSLSPDERAYFIAATDIFHDTPYNVIGRPSLSTQLQNTTIINKSVTYTADMFGIPAGKSWDLNVISLPFVTTTSFQAAADNGWEVLYPPPIPSAANFGGVVACGVESGNATFRPGSTNALVSTTADDYFYDEANPLYPVKRPVYEILSMGLELRNVTASLTKDGSLVRYRLPTQGRKSTIVLRDTGLLAFEVPEAYCLPMPPTTSAEATLIPDSNVDLAAAGSYQMHTIQDAVSDYYLAGNSKVLITAADASTVSPGNCWVTRDNGIDYPLVRGDFDIVGTYFTGMNYESKITLKYRIIVSTVPGLHQPQLMSLAKMSPDYNAKLDSLISHVQSEFSPGVPVAMNPKGEWFKKVLTIGKKVLPKVIPIVKDLSQGDILGAAEGTLNALKKSKETTDRKVGKTELDLQKMKEEIAALKLLLQKLAPSKSK